MEIDEILNHQLSFFKEEDLKRSIRKSVQVVEVKAGTRILKEGGYVKVVPILLRGLLKVIKQKDGKEMLLYYIYPLESCIVSIHCGINDIKSTVDAVAEEDSMAVLIPSSLVGSWQQGFPSFNQFTLNLYQKRFDDVLNAYNALAFQSLDKRLIDYLHAKAKATDNSTVRSTHQELGDELGTARETISRILKKLESDGKVKLGRGIIEVL